MAEIPFVMPKMGESITEGTILTWLVGEGESFQEGDILVEVATDKVDNEVPAPAAGTLLKIIAQEKEVIPVGNTIAMLELLEEGKVETAVKAPGESGKERVEPPKKVAASKKAKVTKPLQVGRQNNNTFFSPLIVEIAKEQHISFEELARIPATGNEGRLRKSDLYAYLEEGRPYQFVQPEVVPDPTAYRIPQLNLDKGNGKRVKMDRMRQMIADHMVYSKHTSPHVTAYVEADLTEMVQWRNENKVAFQEKYGEKLTFTPLFVEAVSKAVLDFPNINASVDGDTVILKEDINIGMAAALPSGNLIVPVVKNADQKGLDVLAAEVNSLSSKARDNKLNADDIKGSTFTISNVGTFGSLMGTPIINQPEVAILALGIIKKRAEVITTEKGDEIAIRSMMYLSLSFDHRVVDGYLGGSFLKRVADYLEQFNTTREI
ncbi:dihydrolipoamide acetyltransferase family protein [Spongiimicrobium salis]|uniref:dihydrolipoamide acetyltransferase family protein n=1 Tax=Spongiimicrobium salis TaxID=1667022 RepID=UPI00374D49DD